MKTLKSYRATELAPVGGVGLALILWSWGHEDSFAEEVEVGSSEHLSFEHFQSVDVSFDWAGIVWQGESVLDGVEVAA